MTAIANFFVWMQTHWKYHVVIWLLVGLLIMGGILALLFDGIPWIFRTLFG